MSTILTNVFSINGVIDTNKTALENMEAIATAAGSWLTYDVNQGKWCVVINQTGSSVASFNDDNIIGGINVSSSGLRELYNSAEIEFPNADILDQKDFVKFEISDSDRFPNEVDNMLQLQNDLINNSVQAEAIASRELKQNRVDKIVEFLTDYSKIGLKAGNLIDITNSMYNWTNKVFRVITVSEEDSDDGVLNLKVTALEYDAAVYSTAGLTRTARTYGNNIPKKRNNDAIDKEEDLSISEQLQRLLIGNAIAGLLSGGLSAVSRLFEFQREVDPVTGKITDKLVSKQNEGLSIPKLTINGPTEICEGETLTLTIPLTNYCVDDGTALSYEITGISSADIVGVPLIGTMPVSSNAATINIPINPDSLTEGPETMTFTVSGCCSKTVTIKDQWRTTPVYTLTASAASVSECNTLTITVGATNVNDGDAIPYAISGVSLDDIATMVRGGVSITKSLTGSLTADWCDTTTNLVITFNKDADVGTETLLFNLNNGAATLSVLVTNGAQMSVSASPNSITEGQSTTVTVTTIGVANGEYCNYTITGSASGKVSSPSLSGQVLINSNTASLAIQTTDDSVDDGTSKSLTVTFGPMSDYGPCSTGQVTITVLDNDDPAPSNIPCSWTTIPATWCVTRNPSGQAITVTPESYMKVLTAIAGQPSVSVPLSLNCVAGSPSTVTVTSSVSVCNKSGQAGFPANIITSFTAIPVNTPVATGTTTSIVGYPTT
jgi:hypothetical protein